MQFYLKTVGLQFKKPKIILQSFKKKLTRLNLQILFLLSYLYFIFLISLS